MRYNVASLPVTDPCSGVRHEFERRMGLQADSTLGYSITESDDHVRVSIDLPGMTEDGVEITVHRDVLTISGDRPAIVADGGRVLFSNQPYGEFRRSLKLHDSIDPTTVDATLDDGVLTITMKRHPEHQPRQVNIRRTQD